MNLLSKWLGSRFNVYLILFAVLLIGTGVAGGIFYLSSSKSTVDTLPQSLSQTTLDQLANSDVNVGEPKHTLSVQSNAVFAGDVLVRSNLQIAGTLQVGSNLAIAGLRVTGNSTFDDVQVTNSLAVTGNTSVQGQLNVQKSLSVNGSSTFLGALSAPSLTVDTLHLNGDLTLTHHVTAGGATPSRTNGPALGSGGTATVSGSDTAGTVTINTGSSPSVGCFITLTFSSKFNSTPHMSLTPATSAAGDLSFYVTRSTTSFSVCTASVPPAGATIIYDYITLD
jgi:cytoskeletal protein CcmA (bactofilin family)